jgi:hypothetical protein
MDSYNQLVSRNYLSVFFHKIQLIFLNNIGDLPPYKKEEIPAFDQLDIQLKIWKKEYDKEHKTNPTN